MEVEVTKHEGPHDPTGLGNLVEAGMGALKWLAIFVVISIVLGLAAIGFGVAWWL